MMSSAFLLVFTSLCMLGFGHEDLIRGTTKYGDIIGKRKTLESGKQVDYFLGIPYAEQPERFQHASLWKESWNGTRDATSYGNNCWQPSINFDHPGLSWQFTTENLSEDCLFLNVWTPWPRADNMVVMVWIHGGSFYWGTANVPEYNGEILASSQNVVVVTINYRLGPLGFLNLGNEEVRGNAGLMDQVVALKWIKENIANFGGDPESVTLFGSSAGGGSVGYHLLSPMSRNLFKRAILQSGAPSVPLLQPFNDYYSDGARMLYMESVGCLSLDCLNQLPAYNLTFEYWASVMHYPAVDGIFLPAPVEEMLRQNDFKQTEVLVGTSENEFIANLVKSYPGFSIETNSFLNVSQYREAIRYSLGGAWSPDKSVTDAVCYVYRDWKDPDNGEKMRDAVDDAAGDSKLKCPIIEFANIYASANNSVYYYSLDKRSSASPWPEWMGTVHGDEIQYIFGHPLSSEFSGYTDEDVALSELLMQLWANFAKYGNPNMNDDNKRGIVEWPRYQPNNKNYVIFDDQFQESVTIDNHPRTPYCYFWKELVPKLEKLNAKAAPTPSGDCSLTPEAETILTSLVKRTEGGERKEGLTSTSAPLSSMNISSFLLFILCVFSFLTTHV